MGKNSIRILLVDDHEVVRKGFKALIELEENLSVSAEANSIEAANKLVVEQQFDLLITDLSLPDGSGLEILKQAYLHDSDLKSIVFSMYDREPFISEALNAGANGYLSKRTAADEVVRAIEVVLSGDAFLSADVLVNLSNSQKRNHDVELDTLTEREREVFLLLARGKLVKEVAQTLDIMPKTAHSHRRNIFEKLNCTSSFELTQLALKLQLINQHDLME